MIRKSKLIVTYILLLIVDIGIYMTRSCQWKVEREYSKRKIKEAWVKNEK